MKKTVALLLLCCVVVAGAAEREEGVCDLNAERERKIAQFTVGSRDDSDSNFVAKHPCRDDLIVIRSCAVISTRGQKVQRFCFRDDKPQYFEYMDVVEYWAAPGN